MAGGVTAMNVLQYVSELEAAKLAALKAKAQVPTVAQYKTATRSAIQALELFTHSEKVGLLGEIEDAWTRLEGG